MDECFLLPLFQNESLCENELNYEPVGGSHMNGFAIRLGNGPLDECRKCS